MGTALHGTPGKPPGTLQPPKGAVVPKAIRAIHYGPDFHEVRNVATADEAARLRDGRGVLWLNVDGLGNVALIARLGELFGLHPLALEDALSVHQRPKLDDYGDHLYLVVRMLHYGAALRTEQVSIFLGNDFVITLQEVPGDCLGPVRDRLENAAGRLRNAGADYLMYAILDAVTDHYFPVLELLGEQVERLEDEVVKSPSSRTLARVHALKRELLDIRRSAWPLREAANALLRSENQLVAQPTRVFLRDCYDHAIRILDVTESNRELVGDLTDIYLSSVSNRMNQVMKVLTIIATIFMPLTFLAGVYGMNFEHMPELRWPWGYPLVWAIMILIVLFMVWLFRRKGWLGGGEEP